MMASQSTLARMSWVAATVTLTAHITGVWAGTWGWYGPWLWATFACIGLMVLSHRVHSNSHAHMDSQDSWRVVEYDCGKTFSTRGEAPGECPECGADTIEVYYP